MRSLRAAAISVLSVALYLMALLFGVAMPARAEGVVRFYYFYHPLCQSCQETEADLLEPLLAELGEAVEVTRVDVSDTENMALLVQIERELGVSGGEVPEVFIGQEALVGAEAITSALRERIDVYASQGGVELYVPAATEPVGGTPQAGSGTAVAETSASGENVVRAVLLWSDTCPACHDARERVLPPIVARYGAQLELRAAEMNTDLTQETWNAIITALAIPRDRLFIPMLLVGDQILVGSDEIEQQLPLLIEEHLATGGLAFPVVPGVDFRAYPRFGGVDSVATPTANDAKPIHAVYFYQPGCDECDRAELDLTYVQSRYPQLVLERYNVREEPTFNQYLCDKLGVPEGANLVAPAFFVGDHYLVTTQVRASQIEDLIVPLVGTGAEAWWAGWEAESTAAEEAIVSRFEAFGLLTVVGAGLLDGVNPCAFATMIFLVSYLSVRKRKGRELLLTGAAFTLGVFMTYLAVGLGLLTFLDSLPFLNSLGKWFYGFTAAICLALAVGSLLDYRKARQGKLHEMGLTLPDSLRNYSRKLIRKGTSGRRFVLSALLLGAAVSVVELACTGQVYLPTILYVLGVPALRARATLSLLLYNLMFIMPLVGIFILVYYGTTSEQMTAWLHKHAAAVKLGMAALFLVLAAWLIYGVL